MQRSLATTATMIFTEDRFVSLSKVAEILTTALLRVKEVVAAVETTQNCVIVTCDHFCAHLEVVYGDRETNLTVCVADRNDALQSDTDTKRAHLAFLLFPLALNLPVTFLVWPSSDVRIPRLRFIEGLADSFSPHKDAITPREKPKDDLPNEDELRSLIRQASGSLTGANSLAPPPEPKSMFERLADAARPVLSSLH
ncbi:hypothetical protein [uncultured Pelagimonas sp.]|uniref:hypothetical protein n=1 Tax=uncultured Pelagimonas sp. TaxID=1618102 RepID=UPI0026056C5B|nr:hypothetical protein [uncultured Pelagimonas sp.]